MHTVSPCQLAQGSDPFLNPQYTVLFRTCETPPLKTPGKAGKSPEKRKSRNPLKHL